MTTNSFCTELSQGETQQLTNFHAAQKARYFLSVNRFTVYLFRLLFLILITHFALYGAKTFIFTIKSAIFSEHAASGRNSLQ